MFERSLLNLVTMGSFGDPGYKKYWRWIEGTLQMDFGAIRGDTSHAVSMAKEIHKELGIKKSTDSIDYLGGPVEITRGQIEKLAKWVEKNYPKFPSLELRRECWFLWATVPEHGSYILKSRKKPSNAIDGSQIFYCGEGSCIENEWTLNLRGRDTRCHRHGKKFYPFPLKRTGSPVASVAIQRKWNPNDPIYGHITYYDKGPKWFPDNPSDSGYDEDYDEDDD